MSVPIRDSGSLAQQVAARTGRQWATATTGTVTGKDDTGSVSVNVGGLVRTGVLTVAPVSVGDTVLVLSDAGRSYIAGVVSSVSTSSVGTVVAVPTDSYLLPVSTDTGTVSAQFVAAYTPTVGDTVFLAWLDGSAVIIGAQGKTGTPPPPAEPPPPPPPVPSPPPTAPRTGTTRFTPSGDGTYRDGSWLSASITGGNVMQGAYGSYGTNQGAWFYGGRIHSTLHGSTVTSARIYLLRENGGTYAAQAAHLQRVSDDSRPSGALSFAAETHDVSLAVGDQGWYPLPTAFAQALVDSGGSIGVKSDPYVRLAGLANSANAALVEISWRS